MSMVQPIPWPLGRKKKNRTNFQGLFGIPARANNVFYFSTCHNVYFVRKTESSATLSALDERGRRTHCSGQTVS